MRFIRNNNVTHGPRQIQGNYLKFQDGPVVSLAAILGQVSLEESIRLVEQAAKESAAQRPALVANENLYRAIQGIFTWIIPFCNCICTHWSPYTLGKLITQQTIITAYVTHPLLQYLQQRNLAYKPPSAYVESV